MPVRWARIQADIGIFYKLLTVDMSKRSEMLPHRPLYIESEVYPHRCTTTFRGNAAREILARRHEVTASIRYKWNRKEKYTANVVSGRRYGCYATWKPSNIGVKLARSRNDIGSACRGEIHRMLRGMVNARNQ